MTRVFFFVANHSLYRFIEFGRGKAIPLTPDSSTDLPNEMSNTGKVVVKKRINKIEKGDNLHTIFDKDSPDTRLANGKVGQRKKKGRLYSLGGNEPIKKPRGRLDRLRTVGTFDLGTEITVLSEVARNLNEKIISGDIRTVDESSTKSVRRLSVIPDGSEKVSNNSSGSSGSRQTKFTTVRSASAQVPSDTANTTPVKNQHSADDVKTLHYRAKNQKPRSVSSSSYLDTELRCLTKGRPLRHQHKKTIASTTTTTTTTFCDRRDVKDKNNMNIVNLSIQDSNKIEMADEVVCTDEPIKSKDKGRGGSVADNDSNKIELDMKSAEDNTKNDDDHDDDDGGDDDNVNEVKMTERQHRKPVLRKSKRIVRTDSEIFADELLICKNEIVLKNNLDIQIHKEPVEYDETESSEQQPLPYVRKAYGSTTSSTTNGANGAGNGGSRKESSDIDDICSPRDFQKSTDNDSSRNQSTDELDTVFSDTTDLERLQREYRELVRSNLQREYKSDGDSLDEVGKRRNDYLKWKNQSFENDFELYNENEGSAKACSSSSERHPCGTAELSRVCSPHSHITIMSNSSEASSTKPMTDDGKYVSSRASDESRATKKSSSIKESDSSTLTSPMKTTTKSDRPSKLDISGGSGSSSAKENSISTLFEKRFGKFKKMNKLLNCKRFSTSALYDKKKVSDGEQPEEKKQTTSKGKENSMSRLFGSRFSPCKLKTTGESKHFVYASKLSLFNSKMAKTALFATKKPGMYSNSSRSNSELNVDHDTTTSSTSTRTKLTEYSKSNSELNKYKSSPSRLSSSTKRSIKDNRNSSTVCLYKEPGSSPLSEEFYNKTGSVRLSAMELYEKFCSADFGGLYKHESSSTAERMQSTACGGYRTWHEYRLSHKGLGAVKKYAQNKHARLLRQKSEPKFSFKGDTKGDPYFPEEEDEDIDEEDMFEQEGLYDDEYEDEEGDYYEDEEVEEEEEEDDEMGDEEEDDDENEQQQCNAVDPVDCRPESPPPQGSGKSQSLPPKPAPAPSSLASMVKGESQTSQDDYETGGYHSEIEYTGHLDIATGTDSEVDEIYLMPRHTGKSVEDYVEYGFENKQFSLEHSSMLRKSASMENNVNYPVHQLGDEQQHIQLTYSPVNEIKNFGSDEVLTIYKICSKDDILNMGDVIIHKPDIHHTQHDCPNDYDDNACTDECTPDTVECRIDYDQPCTSSSIENAVDQLIRNAPIDLPMLDIDAATDCFAAIDRSESMEIFSSSSGTLHSGSTLTEYAFDTVRNLKLDSCSTSKLSLSLKSEIFDDYTITPEETKVLHNCVFEDFTLTPEGSFSETSGADIQTINIVQAIQTSTTDDVQSATMQLPPIPSISFDVEQPPPKSEDHSLTSNDVVLIVDKFLANEHKLLAEQLAIDTSSSTNDLPRIVGMQHKKIRKNIFDFDFDSMSPVSSMSISPARVAECLDGEKFSIIDLDDDSLKNVVSAFTSEITKEFDLLFSRAEQDNELLQTLTDDVSVATENRYETSPPNSVQSTADSTKMPTRYSMQKLEPYFMGELPMADETTTTTVSHRPLRHSTSNNEYSKVLDIQHNQSHHNQQQLAQPQHESSIHKRVMTKLKANRSQSLGNLSNKTRCFPL